MTSAGGPGSRERLPGGTRLLVRRAIPHPGAPLTVTDVHGYRYPLCLTHRADPAIAFLEAPDRGPGHCEPVIRDRKDTGWAPLPSADVAANPAWLTAVLIAGDLLAWFRGIGLSGTLRAATPARLRDTLLPRAVRLIRTGRRVVIRVAVERPDRDGGRAVRGARRSPAARKRHRPPSDRPAERLSIVVQRMGRLLIPHPRADSFQAIGEVSARCPIYRLWRG